VSQDCVIVEIDCGTERSLEMKAIVQGGATIASLGERILGRTTAEDIVDPKTNEIVIPAGTLLDEPMIAKIEASPRRPCRSARRWSASRSAASAPPATGVTSPAARR
jgi:DNA-directed RNA polymerase subunit beta'